MLCAVASICASAKGMGEGPDRPGQFYPAGDYAISNLVSEITSASIVGSSFMRDAFLQ